MARHLQAPVTLAFAQPFHPDHATRLINLNPSQRLPFLKEEGQAREGRCHRLQ